MEALKSENNYTIDDIYALRDGERAELIDGKIYYMAPPSTGHQRLLNYISTEINLLSENNRNYVEPDISVICDRDKITDQGCNGAPDWVIEIVSPGSRKMDYYKKLFKYRTAGVREYWVVDPDKKCVTVYSFDADNMEEYLFGEEIPAGIYEGFYINIGL